MEEMSQYEAGWLRLKVPLPYALKWVNAYLLPGEEGWTLIDPGLRTAEAERVWEQALKEQGIGWDRIARIVLTHHHPDHYGLAGWFQSRTGAPVWMSDAARRAADAMWGTGQEALIARQLEAFREHGLPEDMEDDMRRHLGSFIERVTPQPEQPVIITAGTSVRMAGRDWELIGGVGHAPGHLSFYDRQQGRLLCGDQVLPDITPNIGWMPEGDPNPLGSFLDSLEKMQHLDAAVAYPGHRNPFTGFDSRVTDILRHHERRLHKIMEAIGTSATSSFEVCERLFGTHLRSNPHNLRFALAETIAHLILLERRGMLHRITGPGGAVSFRQRT